MFGLEAYQGLFMWLLIGFGAMIITPLLFLVLLVNSSGYKEQDKAFVAECDELLNNIKKIDPNDAEYDPTFNATHEFNAIELDLLEKFEASYGKLFDDDKSKAAETIAKATVAKKVESQAIAKARAEKEAMAEMIAERIVKKMKSDENQSDENQSIDLNKESTVG